MNLVQRVQDILLKPKETWPQIASEPGDATSLYKDYLIYLALVPAVAGFIGLTLFGVGGFGFSFRMPIGWGLANMVVSFVMSLVAVFLLSLIANALAPNFGGTKDAMMALKLVAYGSTAAAEVMGAMMGGGGVPFASQDLKSWLPEKLGGLTREGFEVQSGAAMGIAGSTAHATYTAGEQQIRLTITDVGGLGGLMSIAAWANVTVDKESNGQVEKVYKQGQRTIREEYRKDGSQAEYTVVLGNGLIVELQADQSSIDKVKQAMAGIDLGKMEGAQRPPKT